MILAGLIFILLGAGVLAAIAARWSAAVARWISLAATALDLALILDIWVRHAGEITLTASSAWLEQIDWVWIPAVRHPLPSRSRWIKPSAAGADVLFGGLVSAVFLD